MEDTIEKGGNEREGVLSNVSAHERPIDGSLELSEVVVY